MSEAGPFPSVEKFHNWFAWLFKRRMDDPNSIPVELFRKDLPDDIEIRFTQGDLHRSNVILTSPSHLRFQAVLDWEQAGWLPAYWEDRKAHWTAWPGEDWSEKDFPHILDQYQLPWNHGPTIQSRWGLFDGGHSMIPRINRMF